MADLPPTNPPPAGRPAADRRAFLRTAAWGGGIAGLGGLAGLAASRLSRRRAAPAGSRTPLGDEFTYDVSRFQASDPALVVCTELTRFPAGLDRPRNLAVDPAGAILVCGDGGIRKLGPTGEPRAEIRLESPVLTVAPRPDGGLLAGQQGRIAVLDAAGAQTAAWTAFPDGLLPTAIAATPHGVFVADAKNRVVLRLDDQGATQAVIGRRDPARGIAGFVVPSPYFCVRLAPDGLLRISNPGAHRIEAWTLDGTPEVGWGKASFAVDGFCGCCNPVSFDVFPDGSFVTCEKGLPRVKLHNSHGEFTGLVAGPEAFPEYLHAANAGTPEPRSAAICAAVDPQGRIVVLDAVGATIRIMTRRPDAGGK